MASKPAMVEKINAASTVVMAFCTVAITIFTWWSYCLSERAFQAQEEAVVEIGRPVIRGTEVEYKLKNVGGVDLRNVRVFEKQSVLDITKGSFSTVRPYFNSAALELPRLKQGQEVSVASKRISMEAFRMLRDRVGFIDIRTVFQHGVTRKSAEMEIHFACLPSNDGWNCSEVHSVDVMAEVLSRSIAEIKSKKTPN